MIKFDRRTFWIDNTDRTLGDHMFEKMTNKTINKNKQKWPHKTSDLFQKFQAANSLLKKTGILKTEHYCIVEIV